MICAIDFGSCRIRSVFRNPQTPERLSMYSERSEYAMISKTTQHQLAIETQHIPHAECDQALVVYGNHVTDAEWLSRVPNAPLFADGAVPSDDAPARQILMLLTQSMLPKAEGSRNVCVLTVPGVRDGSDQAQTNEAFLSHLVQMSGFRPFVVDPAEAALLATCSDASFTGLCIVMGAQTTTICIARYGMLVSSETLPIGCNWIDAEIAKHFGVRVFDETGTAFLDIESVRQWKADSRINLKQPTGDRERMLSRLYAVVLDRVTRTVTQMLASASARSALHQKRFSVMLAGGGVQAEGFSNLLTEKFIEHDIADRALSIRIASDPETAVVRGALIYGELEARALAVEEAA
ncbi:MAG TPA: cell division protein FtsA [Planctomycetaceae bacterium]|nr:cell division protein FtsA [Planctomycetaceae bacterium]HQZ67466.1 cell division protein FtsA [Planctomycetaceae bacterium]HRA88590.1 cell division protein FtsA [Planctomycetaceae bacterium]